MAIAASVAASWGPAGSLEFQGDVLGILSEATVSLGLRVSTTARLRGCFHLEGRSSCSGGVWVDQKEKCRPTWRTYLWPAL